MKIDIYKSEKNANKFLSVLSGYDVTQIQLPGDINNYSFSLSPFKEEVDLYPTKPLVSPKQVDIEQQIKSQGYAIHEGIPHITIQLTL